MKKGFVGEQVTNLRVSGTLKHEDILMLSNELNKLFGHPVDENAVKKYKRQQKIIIFAIIAPIVGLLIIIFWHEFLGFISTIFSQFQTGHYIQVLSTLLIIPLVIYLAFFIENLKARFRKDQTVFSFEEEGIVCFVNKQKDILSWDVIPQMRILNSGLAFEIKDSDRHTFCMLPDRFFKSRMQRDEIIAYCNSKTKSA